MIKSKYLLVLILHLYNNSDATDNITDNKILSHLNQEDQTITSTSRSLNIPINKVLSIYKQSNIIIKLVIDIIKSEIISKDELNKLINNINYNMNTNINIDTVENIAYKSDNLANIINCINIDKTSISYYHQSDKDILDYLNKSNTNTNISNFAEKLNVNIPKKVILELYLKSSPIVIEVYKEINKQYYKDDLNSNDFWESIRNKLQNYFSNTYLYTSNFTQYINTILYKLDYPWYKFRKE